MSAAEKRICKGGCERDLDALGMRKDAEVCPAEKCRSAWKRSCERWVWDEQQHIWVVRGHGEELQAHGKCRRCEKHFLPSRHVREVAGSNLKDDTKPIRGMLQGTWRRPPSGSSGGKLPGYGTEPWKGEWPLGGPVPKLSCAPLIRSSDGGIQLAPPGFDHRDRLGDLDSTPGPDSKDADKFESLPYSYKRSEKRVSDHSAPWNTRPLCVKADHRPSTIENRRPDWRMVYAHAVVRGELTIEGARRKIATIEAERREKEAEREPSPGEARIARLKERRPAVEELEEAA